MNNDTMLELTKDMPCKTIEVNGAPYLRRYFAGTTADNYDVFVHQFLSADGDEHLHSHPRDSYSLPILGGYVEQMPDGLFEREWLGWVDPERVTDFLQFVADTEWMESPLKKCVSRHITVFDWHRIAEVKPETWSLFIVGPEILPFWYFRDDAGNLEAVKSSPRDWWKDYGPRGEQ